MFDTMTMTKIVGSVCGALLFFLLGNWLADSLYGLGEQPKAEDRTFAYIIPVEGAEAAATETAAPAADPAYTEVAATADAVAGEKTFGKCKSCHNVEGKNGVGPHLNGVVGRNHAAVEGFAYSTAMQGLTAVVWTPEEIYGFLKAPKTWIPGTKMGFAGLASPQDRANVVAYLETLK